MPLTEADDSARSPATLRIAAVVLVLLGVQPLALVIALQPTITWGAEAFIGWCVNVPILVLLCIGVARWLGGRTDRWIDRARALLLAPSPRVFGATVAALTLLLAVFFAWYCYGLQGSTGDEMTQQFQAHLLLHGRLWLAAEPHPEFFGTGQTAVVDGRWFGQFPIGNAILLAAGGAVGAEWLVNPLLAAWTAWLLYRFAASITDETTARGAAILFVVSPFVLFMSASRMNHPGTLAFLMLALAALPRWAESPDVRTVRGAAAVVGFGVAAAATLRPYDALLVALVIGAFQVLVARGSPMRRQSLLWQVGAAVLPLAVVLVANWRTTGHPLVFGYEALNGPGHRPGFHLDPTGGNFTPMQGLAEASAYLYRLNELLGPPIPAVLVIVTTLALVRRVSIWDNLLVALIGALVIGYGMYWWEGYYARGPRFLYSAMPAFLIFVAMMPGVLAARLRRPTLKRAAALILPASIVATWALPGGMPGAGNAWMMAVSVRPPQPETHAHLAAEIDSAGLSHALVFVHESWHVRLAARLQALSLTPLVAERLIPRVDGCALEQALDEADTVTASMSRGTTLAHVLIAALRAGTPTPLPGLTGGASISLLGGTPSTAECARQLAADSAGAAPLTPFLRYDGIGADGRLGGRVVFARDYGTRDELLRARFGDRTWYRYQPRAAGDAGPRFVPYVRGALGF